MKKTLVFSILALTAAAVAYFAPTAVAGNSVGPAAACGANSVNACVVTAPGDPVAFLCYSKWQVDPGSWPVEQAKQLMADGYWAPYAETTVATATRLATGVYLACNGFMPTGGIVGADGTNLGDGTVGVGAPAFYPEAR